MEELQKSEARLRQVVENTDEVFWATDPEKRRLLYVSPAYEKIWGRPVADLYANPKSWSDGIYEEDRDRVWLAALAQVNKPNTIYKETYRIVRPDGQMRWILDRGFSVMDKLGRVERFVGTASDITEYRTLEQQLWQAQKMEAIGTLAGGIAHDFNNILGTIMGFTELAQTESPPPNVANCLDEILRAGKRAGELVRQILAFSRQQEQKRQTVDLQRIVEEAIRLLRAALPATIEFEVQLGGTETIPAVMADPTQIHQVVMNLCTNAAHAMKGRKGRLGVKLERFEADGEFVKTHPRSRGGAYARLIVSDSGHGMQQAVLDRIFEPFFTTKSPGEGTGLGLAVVHGIMQSHEGLITVASTPGEGTKFHLYFPAHSMPEPKAKGEPQDLIRGSGQCVLAVDDEQPLMRMLGRMLAKMGYKYETTADPREAIEMFEREPGRYDVIITDMTMPAMTGLELATRAVKIKPGVPVILMTGYYANLDSQPMETSGVREVLVKPVSFKNLSEVIDRILRNPKSN